MPFPKSARHMVFPIIFEAAFPRWMDQRRLLDTSLLLGWGWVLLVRLGRGCQVWIGAHGRCFLRRLVFGHCHGLVGGGLRLPHDGRGIADAAFSAAAVPCC